MYRLYFVVGNTQTLRFTELVSRGVFAPLNRHNVLLEVFQIIAESVPNIRSLDISLNMIFDTEHFEMLKRYMPDLKSLNLRANNVSTERRVEIAYEEPKLIAISRFLPAGQSLDFILSARNEIGNAGSRWK